MSVGAKPRKNPAPTLTANLDIFPLAAYRQICHANRVTSDATGRHLTRIMLQVPRCIQIAVLFLLWFFFTTKAFAFSQDFALISSLYIITPRLHTQIQ